MTAIVSFLCAIAVSASLTLSTVAHGAEGKAEPAATVGESDPAELSQARALMEEGRFADALALLRPMIQQSPAAPNVVFLTGLSAMEAAVRPGVSEDERDDLLDEAVAAFRSMLIERPDLVRVRLELARAFYFQRKDGLAREHFERVLAGDLPPPVVAKVRRFLGEIRARRRWNLYSGVALAPDSNIGAGSDDEVIHIYGLPFERDAEELTTSGIGLSLWGGGEYQHPLGDRLRLRAGGDISRREYKGSEFDQTNLALHLGPRWLAGPRTEMSLLGVARRHLVDSDADYDVLGVRFEAARRLSPRLTANTRVSWSDRRYRTSDSLDGPVLDLMLGGSWVATPTVRVDGSFGYDRERPGSLSSQNSSRWLRLGFQKALPRGFTVGGSAQLRWTDYRGNWFPYVPDGSARKDRTRALSVSVYHRRFTLHGFSPKLVLTHEGRDSNAQLHDYRRNRAELRFVRQF